MSEGITIRAAALLDGKHCTLLNTDDAVKRVMDAEHPIWLDVVVHDREAGKHFLEDSLGFHELAVEDALSETERPSIQEFETEIFLVIPAITPTGITEVGFFLRPRSLVTVASSSVPVLDQWFARWTHHPKRIGEHPAFLLHALVDALVDEFFPFVDQLEDEADRLGDRIFAGETHHVAEILGLKRKFLEVRRRLVPVRDILNALLRRDMEEIPDNARPYFQDIYDHILRISEQADINRETLASMLDVHLSTVSNNLNDIVKKMTVLSTVLMVMTLVAGVYGMNFQHMPELHWAMGYPFALGLMVLFSVLVMIGFRIAKWL